MGCFRGRVAERGRLNLSAVRGVRLNMVEFKDLMFCCGHVGPLHDVIVEMSEGRPEHRGDIRLFFSPMWRSEPHIK
jgi:hypothetical protein